MRFIQRFGEMTLTRSRLAGIVVCIGVVIATVTLGIGPSSTAKGAGAVKAPKAQATTGHASAAQAPANSVRTVAANTTSAAAETDYSGGHLMTADPKGGYWTVSWLGAVTAHGGSPSFGSPALSGVKLTKPIVAMAATPDGQGYWLVGSDGGIFSYGDAKFYGSTGALHLNQPIVDMTATRSGGGYWLVASDGGIFTFGNATFYGSTGAMHLNKPIVGMAATPDGAGYWLVASDGGIFTYGDAPFDGTLGGSNVVLGVLVNPTATAYTEVTGNGVAVVPTLTPAPATPTASPTSVPTVATTGLGFGVSVPALVSETASQQVAALANMKSIGLSWLRVDADWSWLQPTASTFDWAPLDQLVQEVQAAGMNVDLDIDNSPTWARDASAQEAWGEPSSAAIYSTFAGEVAARYGPMGVHAYEIWNEENIQAFWFPAPNPTLYTAMLKGAYAAIKAVEPSATVISGGLSPAADDGAGDIAPIEFLQDVYADGGQGSFDAVGDHAYSYPTLPDDVETYSGWSQMNQTSPSLRSVMAANGDSSKQIWITEIGAPSDGPNGVGTVAQAEEVTQAVAGAKSASWIGEEFFYTYEDSASDPDYFGLLNADGSAKPAWAALAAALAS